MSENYRISQLSFKMLFFNIVGLIVINIRCCSLRLLVMLLRSLWKRRNKIRAKKYNSITKINGNMKGMGILNQMESVFMIGGESCWVYSYDVNSKELIDV